MKKLSALLILATIFVITPAFPQEGPDEKYRKEYKEFIKNSEISKTMDATFEAMRDMYPAELTGQMDKFTKAMTGMIQEFMEKDMLAIYHKYIPYEDLVEINKFYRTPSGRRLVESQPKIAAETALLMQQTMMPKMMELLMGMEGIPAPEMMFPGQ